MRSTCFPSRWALPISSMICASTSTSYAVGLQTHACPPRKKRPAPPLTDGEACALLKPFASLGDLGDELLQHGRGERLVGLRRHDECAGTTNHVEQIIALEVGFERKNGQAVDADPGAHRIIARVLSGAPAVVGTVAGDIDDASGALKSARREKAQRVVDDAADRR